MIFNKLHDCTFRFVMLQCWYGVGTVLVWSGYGAGMVLVQSGYGVGTKWVRCQYSHHNYNSILNYEIL